MLSRPAEAYRVQFDMKAINGRIGLAEAARIFQDINNSGSSTAPLPERYNRIFEEALLASGSDLIAWEDFQEMIGIVKQRLQGLNIGPAEPSKLYQANLPEKVVQNLQKRADTRQTLVELGSYPISVRCSRHMAGRPARRRI